MGLLSMEIMILVTAIKSNGREYFRNKLLKLSCRLSYLSELEY